MPLLEKLLPKACTAGKTLVLPEGQDPRVMHAAARIAAQGIANVKVLATTDERRESARGVHFDGLNVEMIDHLQSPWVEQFAHRLQELRAHKGMTLEKARETVADRLYFGNLMLREGLADGLVAGSIAATSDMVRSAFHCIGTASEVKIASSCFVMDLAQPTPSGREVLLYADSGVNPNPTAEQLVDIAIATIRTKRALIGGEPRVAFLSFSTKGSARHELVEKMVKAGATRIGASASVKIVTGKKATEGY